jgi:hypothetical protein
VIENLSLCRWLRLRLAPIALVLALVAFGQGAYTLALLHGALVYEAAPICVGAELESCRARIRVEIEPSSAHIERGLGYYPAGYEVAFPGGTVAVVSRSSTGALTEGTAIAEFWHQEVTALHSLDGRVTVSTQFDPRERFVAARGLFLDIAILGLVAFAGWVFCAIRSR